MKLTKLPNDKGLWAVAVEKEITTYDIHDKETTQVALMCFGGELGKDFKPYPIVIPNLKFEILGFCTRDEISFDVAEWVDKTGYLYDMDGYVDYTNKSLTCFTPEISFRSLLSAAGLNFENPYPNVETGDKIESDIFWEAQSNLIEKLIIIREI